jgi:hypothetical protein
MAETIGDRLRRIRRDVGRYQGQWIPGPPPVRLWLQSDRTRVLIQVFIQVWDGSDRMPQPQEPEPYKENGHGLLLVAHESSNAGVYVLDGSSGKVVWAEVR